MGIGNDIKGQFGAMGKMTNQLIIVNVIVFLVLGISAAFSGLFTDQGLDAIYSEWLAVHPNLKELLYKPWTVITYGFMHSGFLHILFNLLWFFWFGKLLEEYIGKRKILPLYIYSVLLGAFFFILSYNVFPAFRGFNPPMVGASAAVMGVVWATVTLIPEHRFHLIFLGPVKIIYIATFMTALDLLGVSGGNAGGAIAHLGGAFMGFLYIKQMQAGNDLSKPFNRLWDGLITLFQPRKKLRVTHRRTTKQTRKTTKPKSSKRDYLKGSQPETIDPADEKERQQKLDKILDKISKGGYDSLSKAEKAFLFKVSNEKDS